MNKIDGYVMVGGENGLVLGLAGDGMLHRSGREKTPSAVLVSQWIWLNASGRGERTYTIRYEKPVVSMLDITENGL